MSDTKNIYTKRLECFEMMIDNTKLQHSTDEEYLNVSMIEGKSHINAYNRLELLQKEYKNIYKNCEKIIKQ